MPFTCREFPGQRFESIEEYEEARRRRTKVEASLANRRVEDFSTEEQEPVRVTATVIPAPKDLVESKVVALEAQLQKLMSVIESLESRTNPPKRNSEGLKVGTVLYGETKGKNYTLEVLEEGYLCSDGSIYDSLSGAALGVSGNRRSGWKFWRNKSGNPIGDSSGRFPKNAAIGAVQT